jgi:hypothetical protein
MRKGLVTLGVVALVLAVSPSFAEAPILSCLPDIVVSDLGLGGQTADTDMFIFSDAVNLDDLVFDADTADDQLRWSGIDPAGEIEINGIMLDNAGVDTLNPGASDLRDVSALATIRNATWDAAPPGAGTTGETIIELYVSDATTVTQGSMKITTVDTDGTTGSQADAVLPPVVANYTFDSGAEGWNWFEEPAWIIPTHSATGGALTMTEPATHDSIVFGAYESPQDPALAVMPKLGCIQAARYQIASSGSASPAATPGFRLRGASVHVIDVGGGVWQPDFGSLDFNSLDQVQYGTIDFIMNAPGGDYDGRVPGAGQEYSVMCFPRQIAENLLSDNAASPVIHYFSADLLDLEGGVEFDSGTLSVDSIVVESIDRPEIGTGTAVPGMTFATADFASGWATGTKALLPPAPIAGSVTPTATASGLAIDVGTQAGMFEAWCENTAGAAIEPGRTYRMAFWCTSTEQPGSNAGPLVRVNLDSSAFIWSAVKELKGGSLLCRLNDQPSLMELWAVAPSEKASTPGQTEPMKLKFSSYQADNSVPAWPVQTTVEGTVAVTSIDTEVFDY